jgi:hypothetical protein
MSLYYVMLKSGIVMEPGLTVLKAIARAGGTNSTAALNNATLIRNIPTQAQCKFPDGATITVTYSYERTNALKMATDEPLITIKGISVPVGEYTLSPAKDSQNNWVLTMKKQTRNGKPSALSPLPMSVTTSTLRAGNFSVSFDQTGGSCMMHWTQEKSNILLSLEFIEMNADLRLIPPVETFRLPPR